jgi:hypothetical protein
MRIPTLAYLVFLVGCIAETTTDPELIVDDVEQFATCSSTTCGDDTGEGTETIKACSACTYSDACSLQCTTSTGALSSCGAVNHCQKYDVYCAYPTLTDVAVYDINETGAGGTYAYMYFGSSSPYGNKSGTFARSLGGQYFQNTSAWASNFRGPKQIYGETERYQWEFFDSYEQGMEKSFGAYGTPYLYGRQCVSVKRLAPVPTLSAKTEQVYEDDECFFGICNPDDFVGSFTIDRSVCNREVFATGARTGWSTKQSAPVTNDLRTVNYRLWCYSCLNSQSTTCSEGVTY